MAKYRDKKFNGFDPIEITQLVRGRIFTFLDIFMTHIYDSQQVNVTSCMNQVVDLIYEFLDFTVEYLVYFKKHLYLLEYLEKNPELYLIDEKCAFMSCYYEILFTLKRIFGRDERVNSFYKVL